MCVYTVAKNGILPEMTNSTSHSTCAGIVATGIQNINHWCIIALIYLHLCGSKLMYSGRPMTTLISNWRPYNTIVNVSLSMNSSSPFPEYYPWIFIKLSLKFIPKGHISNVPALSHIMAWCRSGDKPLSEPMMVSLLTHISDTRPEWVKREISEHMSSLDTSLMWMPKNTFDIRLILVQVWCRQTAIHYSSQYWPICMSPDGVNRPPWVNQPTVFFIF